MRIVGDHIMLRVVENDDLDLLFKWENDPEIQKFNVDSQKLSKEEIQKFIDGLHDIYFDKQLRLMIVNMDNNETIGTLDIFDYDDAKKSFGVGIVIFLKKNRGKGHATKAMDLFLRYSASHLGVKTIFCNIDPANKRSVKFFKKNGFEKVSNNITEHLSDKIMKGMDFYVLNIL